MAFSEGASAAFAEEMLRRLAQSSLSRRQNDTMDCATFADVLVEAAENGNRVGRRIVGLSDTSKRTG